MPAVLQIDGRVDAAEREIGRLNKVILGLQESMQGAANSSKSIEGEAQKAARAAMELGSTGKTAAAMYQAALAQARIELKGGIIDKQEFKRQVELAAIALQQETRDLQKQATEQERLRQFAAGVSQEVQTGSERQRARLKELEAAWKAGHLSAEDYRRAVSAAHQAGTQLPGPIASARAEVLGLVTGFAAGFTSVSGILTSVQELRKEAAALRAEQMQKQLGVAGSQGEVIKMLGMGVSQDDAQAFIAKIQKITTEAKFGDLGAANQAAADVLSATMGNRELTAHVLTQALPLQRNKPADVPAVAAAIADTARYMDAKTEDDVKAATALVVSAVGQARITAYAEFKEAAQGMAAANAASTTEDKIKVVRESAALWAGISQQISDPSGAQTKTAMAGVVATMEKLLPEKDKVVAVEDTQRAELEAKREHLRVKIDQFRRESETTPEKNEARKAAIDLEMRDVDAEIASGRRKTGGGRSVRLTDTEVAERRAKLLDLEDRKRKLDERVRAPALVQADIQKAEADLEETNKKLTGETRKGTGLKDTYARIEAMWQSPETQQQFLDAIEKGGFRAPVKLSMRQLADPQSQFSKMVRQAMSGVSTDTTQLAMLQKSLDAGTTQLALKTDVEDVKSSVASFDMGATVAARREFVEKLLTGTGEGEGVMRRTKPYVPWSSRLMESWFGSTVAAQAREQGLPEEEIGMRELMARRREIVPSADQLSMTTPGYLPKEATDEQRQVLKLIDDAVSTLRNRQERFAAAKTPTIPAAAAARAAAETVPARPASPAGPQESAAGPGTETVPAKPARRPQTKDEFDELFGSPAASSAGTPPPAAADPQMGENNRQLAAIADRLQRIHDAAKNAPTVGPSAAASAGLGAQRESR